MISMRILLVPNIHCHHLLATTYHHGNFLSLYFIVKYKLKKLPFPPMKNSDALPGVD